MATKRTTELPADEDIDTSDIPETDFSKGVRGKHYHDPYDPALPDEPVKRVVGDEVHYTPARRRGSRDRALLAHLREALEQVAWMADAEQPLSVKAGEIAREALQRLERDARSLAE